MLVELVGCCIIIFVVLFMGLDIVINVLLIGGEEVGLILIFGVMVVCVLMFIIIGVIINNKKV